MASNSKLTAQQNKLVAEAGKDIVTACLSTSPIDRATCLAAIGRAYAYLGLRPPEVVFVDSPMQAMTALQKQTQVSSRKNAPLRSLETWKPRIRRCRTHQLGETQECRWPT